MQPPLPPAPRAGFVSVLAKITLILAGLSVAWSLVQGLIALLVSDDWVTLLASRDWPIPAGLIWALVHRVPLSLGMLALSVLTLVTAWGLLKRREWARRVFIALLLVSAVTNLLSLLLVGQMFDAMIAMYPQEFLHSADGQAFIAQMQASRVMSMATSAVGVLTMAVLHVWIVWKLCSAGVRAEFRAPAA